MRQYHLSAAGEVIPHKHYARSPDMAVKIRELFEHLLAIARGLAVANEPGNARLVQCHAFFTYLLGQREDTCERVMGQPRIEHMVSQLLVPFLWSA